LAEEEQVVELVTTEEVHEGMADDEFFVPKITKKQKKTKVDTVDYISKFNNLRNKQK
jgi:hypothetical protein